MFVMDWSWPGKLRWSGGLWLYVKRPEDYAPVPLRFYPLETIGL